MLKSTFCTIKRWFHTSEHETLLQTVEILYFCNMKKLALLLGIVLLASCQTGKDKNITMGKETNQAALQYILENEKNTSSIVPWIHDSIKMMYPDLVMLIDPIYQYERNKDIQKEMDYMVEQGRHLCKYYDTANIWTISDEIEEYDKIDSVIEYTKDILDRWAMDNASMMIASDIYVRLNKVRQYWLYYKMSMNINVNYNYQLEEEWKAYIKLEDTFSELVECFIDWWYADASGWSCGRIRCAKHYKIDKAHMSLYERDLGLSFPNEYPSIITGVYQEPAKQMLVSCCLAEYNALCSDHDMMAKGKEYGLDVKAHETISKLSHDIDEWLAARNEWTGSICCDWNRGLFHISTSQMLIDWANIVSCLD